MAMLVVVPGEECLAMGTRVLDTAKAFGEIRAIFHGLELRLRVRVIVRDIGAAVAFGDLQIDQETGHWFGAHGGSPIRVQSQLTRQDIMAVSYTHLRAHETRHDLVCRLLL